MLQDESPPHSPTDAAGANKTPQYIQRLTSSARKPKCTPRRSSIDLKTTSQLTSLESVIPETVKQVLLQHTHEEHRLTHNLEIFFKDTVAPHLASNQQDTQKLNSTVHSENYNLITQFFVDNGHILPPYFAQSIIEKLFPSARIFSELIAARILAIYLGILEQLQKNGHITDIEPKTQDKERGCDLTHAEALIYQLLITGESDNIIDNKILQTETAPPASSPAESATSHSEDTKNISEEHCLGFMRALFNLIRTLSDINAEYRPARLKHILRALFHLYSPGEIQLLFAHLQQFKANSDFFKALLLSFNEALSDANIHQRDDAIKAIQASFPAIIINFDNKHEVLGTLQSLFTQLLTIYSTLEEVTRSSTSKQTPAPEALRRKQDMAKEYVVCVAHFLQPQFVQYKIEPTLRLTLLKNNGFSDLLQHINLYLDRHHLKFRLPDSMKNELDDILKNSEDDAFNDIDDLLPRLLTFIGKLVSSIKRSPRLLSALLNHTASDLKKNSNLRAAVNQKIHSTLSDISDDDDEMDTQLTRITRVAACRASLGVISETTIHVDETMPASPADQQSGVETVTLTSAKKVALTALRSYKKNAWVKNKSRTTSVNDLTSRLNRQSPEESLQALNDAYISSLAQDKQHNESITAAKYTPRFFKRKTHSRFRQQLLRAKRLIIIHNPFMALAIEFEHVKQQLEFIPEKLRGDFEVSDTDFNAAGINQHQQLNKARTLLEKLTTLYLHNLDVDLMANIPDIWRQFYRAFEVSPICQTQNHGEFQLFKALLSAEGALKHPSDELNNVRSKKIFQRFNTALYINNSTEDRIDENCYLSSIGAQLPGQNQEKILKLLSFIAIQLDRAQSRGDIYRICSIVISQPRRGQTHPVISITYNKKLAEGTDPIEFEMICEIDSRRLQIIPSFPKPKSDLALEASQAPQTGDGASRQLFQIRTPN